MTMDESTEWLPFLKAYTEDETRPIPDNFKIRMQYLVQALYLGRPVEKVMIVMMGQSGAGKSATINSLFEDESLCPTHPSRATTHDVNEFGKQLDLPGMKAWLSLVDTPGTLDADGRDSDNMRTIKNFRNNHPSFQRCLEGDGNRKMVYPNIVLVTVDASEKRLEGKNSHFTQTLEIIKETNLLDFDRVNIIVVATHCAALGIDKAEFIQHKKDKMNVIARVLHQVLGITTVKIVFVENYPKKFRLSKQDGGDFYQLLDGELTPYNLYEAIRDQLRSNEDYLGSLVISRYFNTKCRERCDKSECLFSFFVDTFNKVFDEAEALDAIISHLQLKLENLSYRYLLRGYTPPIQSTRSCPIFTIPSATDMNDVFETTNGIVSSKQETKCFFKISYNTKEQYQQVWKKTVGLNPDMNLSWSPRLTAVGKWEEKGEGLVLSAMYEICVRKSKLRAPMNYFKIKCLDDIDALPDHDGWRKWMSSWVFTPELNEKFDLFFDKWGTHFISRVMIGGSIRIDVSINPECSDALKNKIIDEIGHHFHSLAEGKRGKVNTEFDTTIVFSGGRPPNIRKLQDLTPEIFTDWEKSIRDHPVELEHTIKVTPYYDLVDKAKKRAYSEKAMSLYLENYGKKHSVKRNAEALKEEITALMHAAAFVKEHKWKLVALAAVVPVGTAATVAGVPALAAAVGGAIIAKALK